MDEIPFTESANPLTEELDVQFHAGGIVTLLGHSDEQLFLTDYKDGGVSHDALLHPRFIDLIEELCSSIATVFTSSERCAVVFSGCGTSGRLAYFAARTGNDLMRQLHLPPCFHYLIAGDDKALVTAQELQEDLPQRGILDLKELEKQIFNSDNDNDCDVDWEERTAQTGDEKTPQNIEVTTSDIGTKAPSIVYVGITCGLSAAYVAGQLHYTIHNPAYVSSVLGFNPVSRARKNLVSGFGDSQKRSVHSLLSEMENIIAQEMQKETFRKTFILTPVYGAEPVAGSTRMKGGSATKMLLEAITIRSLSLAYPTSFLKSLGDFHVKEILHCYQAMHKFIYSPSMISNVERIVEAVGDSFIAQGHLYYIAAGYFGVLGFVDASEQMPTFGAHPLDVRGFIPNGWKALDTNQAEEMARLGDTDELFRISTENFVHDVVPTLTENDTVVVIYQTNDSGFVGTLDDLQAITDAGKSAQNTKCTLAVINMTLKGATSDIDECSGGLWNHAAIQLNVAIPLCVGWSDGKCSNLIHRGPMELSLKWILNAITTGGQILNGKVYENRMVDLRLSNTKLFFRAVKLVTLLADVTEELSVKCVIQGIYRNSPDLLNKYSQSSVPELLEPNEVHHHVRFAVGVTSVVPIALLMALRGYSANDAEKALEKNPVVRSAILDAVDNN